MAQLQSPPKTSRLSNDTADFAQLESAQCGDGSTEKAPAYFAFRVAFKPAKFPTPKTHRDALSGWSPGGRCCLQGECPSYLPTPDESCGATTRMPHRSLSVSPIGANITPVLRPALCDVSLLQSVRWQYGASGRFQGGCSCLPQQFNGWFRFRLDPEPGPSHLNKDLRPCGLRTIHHQVSALRPGSRSPFGFSHLSMAGLSPSSFPRSYGATRSLDGPGFPGSRHSLQTMWLCPPIVTPCSWRPAVSWLMRGILFLRQ